MNGSAGASPSHRRGTDVPEHQPGRTPALIEACFGGGVRRRSFRDFRCANGHLVLRYSEGWRRSNPERPKRYRWSFGAKNAHRRMEMRTSDGRSESSEGGSRISICTGFHQTPLTPGSRCGIVAMGSNGSRSVSLGFGHFGMGRPRPEPAIGSSLRTWEARGSLTTPDSRTPAAIPSSTPA